MDPRSVFFIALALSILIVAVLALIFHRRRQRERQLRELLDLADEVQALLSRTAERMMAWRNTVGCLTGDLGSNAQDALDGGPRVREAKHDLLRHRLWIQSRGIEATPAELSDARAALRRVRDRLGKQLVALESAGDALAQATDAAHQAARREPPSLRRSVDDLQGSDQG